MLNLPTKPRVIADPKRDDYTMTFVLRMRRNWQKMSLDERRMVLLDGAEQLDVYAQQMREEAEMLSERIAH